VTCPEAPSVPTNVNASVADLNAVTVSWTAASAPAGCSVTYSVIRAGQTIATGLTAASYTDTTAAARAGYTYTVVAVDEFGSSAPSAKADMSCTTNAVLGLSPYLLENNSYNNSDPGHAHQSTDFNMCSSISDGADGSVNAQWAWDWPDASDNKVRATPTIVYGFKPWNSDSTTPNLPAQVSDVGSLTVDADVAQVVGKGSDSTLGVFAYLTDSDRKAEGANNLTIKGRLFIFMNAYGSTFGPPTTDPISIGGRLWDRQFSSGLENGVMIYNLNYTPHQDASVPVSSLHLDVASFLSDALSSDLIPTDLWLASVETVNLIWQGAGSTTLTNYKVQFQAKQ
jgi:hypothetical protein